MLNCELPDLIRGRKGLAQMREVREVIVLHQLIPVHKRRSGLRMRIGEFIESFAGDDVHLHKSLDRNIQVALMLSVQRTNDKLPASH